MRSVRDGTGAVDGLLLILGQGGPIRCEPIPALEHRSEDGKHPTPLDVHTEDLSQGTEPIELSIIAGFVEQFLHPHHDVPIMGHQPDGRNGDGPGHLHVIRLEPLDDERSVRLLELLVGCAEATEEVGHRDDPLIVGDEPQQLLQRASIVGHREDRLEEHGHHPPQQVGRGHDADHMDECDRDGKGAELRVHRPSNGDQEERTGHQGVDGDAIDEAPLPIPEFRCIGGQFRLHGRRWNREDLN